MTDDRDYASRLDRYRSFVRQNAHLFETPPGGMEILFDDADIAEAERRVAERLARCGLPSEWAQVGVAFEDQHTMILRDAVRFPDGVPGTYFRVLVKSGDPVGSAVLPVYEGQIQLIRHFRHSTRRWQLEIPRGARKYPDEPLDVTARQELEEEIGGIASQLLDLGPVHTSSGLTRESFQIFFAELAGIGRPNLNEGIAEIVPISLHELERLIATGELTDSLTIAAYTRAKLRRLV